ncbi:MAG TPA: sugar phosphate nucleotidyltransferase [Polyangia bacterium]|nr:sugar phosphate nucleotidyltransferase [Polyangia bacterium]
MEGARVQVAILCGGLALRMRPLSERVPKSLFPVAGRPFIDWQLAALVRGGATEVLLLTGHMGDAIAAHVGDGTRQGLRVTYSHEGAQTVGTGGALRLAAQRGLLGPRFVVQYGDSYLELDYRALCATPGDAVMTVWRNQGRLEPSNCVVAGGRVVRFEKASQKPEVLWIDYGASALDRGLVENAPRDLDQLFALLAAEGRLHAFEVDERFYEVGSQKGLAELEALLGGRGQP